MITQSLYYPGSLPLSNDTPITMFYILQQRITFHTLVAMLAKHIEDMISPFQKCSGTDLGGEILLMDNLGSP